MRCRKGRHLRHSYWDDCQGALAGHQGVVRYIGVIVVSWCLSFPFHEQLDQGRVLTPLQTGDHLFLVGFLST